MQNMNEERLQKNIINKIKIEEARIKNLYTQGMQTSYMAGLQKGLLIFSEVLQEEAILNNKS